LKEENIMSENKKPDLIAYTVTKHGDRDFFNRVGAAWSNSKGGCSLRLFALPVSGEIVLLPPKEDESEPTGK
jgi:hypothetical protein